MKVSYGCDLKSLPLRKRFTTSLGNHNQVNYNNNQNIYTNNSNVIKNSSPTNTTSNNNSPLTNRIENGETYGRVYKLKNKLEDSVYIVNNSSDSETSSSNSPKRVDHSNSPNTIKYEVKFEKSNNVNFDKPELYVESSIVLKEENMNDLSEETEDEDDQTDEDDELEDDDEDDDEQSEDRSKLYCVCKKPYNPNLPMIACDMCNEWFHMKCVNVRSSQANKIKIYVCPTCENKTGKSIIWKPSKSKNHRVTPTKKSKKLDVQDKKFNNSTPNSRIMKTKKMSNTLLENKSLENSLPLLSNNEKNNDYKSRVIIISKSNHGNTTNGLKYSIVNKSSKNSNYSSYNNIENAYSQKSINISNNS